MRGITRLPKSEDRLIFFKSLPIISGGFRVEYVNIVSGSLPSPGSGEKGYRFSAGEGRVDRFSAGEGRHRFSAGEGRHRFSAGEGRVAVLCRRKEDFVQMVMNELYENLSRCGTPIDSALNDTIHPGQCTQGVCTNAPMATQERFLNITVIHLARAAGILEFCGQYTLTLLYLCLLYESFSA
ncbi:hypothetical protein M5K25_004506 [Dendrobium thyrsiflorum]|uniref:Uncharacterized protein n=1 Tax=Dendrobium thyrsiflorum TaxID=117978 RepID=A0ABD0VM16_DENTH